MCVRVGECVRVYTGECVCTRVSVCVCTWVSVCVRCGSGHEGEGGPVLKSRLLVDTRGHLTRPAEMSGEGG